MCVISDKIKFCTCVNADKNIEESRHYWVLYRYNEHLDIQVFGQVMFPLDKCTLNYKKNELIISNALTGNECFDKPMHFIEKDRLQIVLNNNGKNSEEAMEFEFEYTSGKWLNIDDPDPFYILENFDNMDSGEIKEIG